MASGGVATVVGTSRLVRGDSGLSFCHPSAPAIVTNVIYLSFVC